MIIEKVTPEKINYFPDEELEGRIEKYLLRNGPSEIYSIEQGLSVYHTEKLVFNAEKLRDKGVICYMGPYRIPNYRNVTSLRDRRYDIDSSNSMKFLFSDLKKSFVKNFRELYYEIRNALKSRKTYK